MDDRLAAETTARENVRRGDADDDGDGRDRERDEGGRQEDLRDVEVGDRGAEPAIRVAVREPAPEPARRERAEEHREEDPADDDHDDQTCREHVEGPAEVAARWRAPCDDRHRAPSVRMRR